MQKKRRYTPRHSLNLPALGGFVLCVLLYTLQFRAYYGSGGDISHILLSMQFPFLHAVPREEYRETESPPVHREGAQEAKDEIRIEVGSPKPTELSGKKPKVLIYHTHTTEAYFKIKDSDYKDHGRWRTLDKDKNVTAVGEKLSECLRGYGIAVLHDTTNHEPPKLATAYSRSVVTMEKYKKKYPSITMFIDVHRDAYGSNPREIADYVTVDGKECARIMFVVGTGKGATGTGYSQMPDFESNYALAKRITENLSRVDKMLVRNIRVKPGRYNQHISNQCLLIEVGHNANTINQALNSVDYLAAAIADAAGLADGRLRLAP